MTEKAAKGKTPSFHILLLWTFTDHDSVVHVDKVQKGKSDLSDCMMFKKML